MTPARLARLGLRLLASMYIYYALEHLFWSSVMIGFGVTSYHDANSITTYGMFIAMSMLLASGLAVWRWTSRLVPFFLPAGANHDPGPGDERWSSLLMLTIGLGLAFQALSHVLSVFYAFGAPKPIQGTLEAFVAAVMIVGPAACGDILKRLFTTNWWSELLALRARIQGRG